MYLATFAVQTLETKFFGYSYYYHCSLDFIYMKIEGKKGNTNEKRQIHMIFFQPETYALPSDLYRGYLHNYI